MSLKVEGRPCDHCVCLPVWEHTQLLMSMGAPNRMRMPAKPHSTSSSDHKVSHKQGQEQLLLQAPGSGEGAGQAPPEMTKALLHQLVQERRSSRRALPAGDAGRLALDLSSGPPILNLNPKPWRLTGQHHGGALGHHQGHHEVAHLALPPPHDVPVLALPLSPAVPGEVVVAACSTVRGLLMQSSVPGAGKTFAGRRDNALQFQEALSLLPAAQSCGCSCC